ncbi:MAPEG family protein [Microvirga sp. ACRRW]|uniref:MAPEG family protein n=1 Tax=Microvirga sp. ACRRW TaxID=2918205 RepID=UPI001EF6B1E5|nr:MAPEG family protein [Microvirga sp. ACRRW]MCG7393862.1 MAPEG family protein [Microvirga sp. ACRRW]
MTIPQWALLGFAVWTLLVLFGTVGVYRWSRILTGRARISEWQANVPQGSDWYQRAMRAHMNCVENLPVFTAIVVCATAAGADNPLLDLLAGVILVARICQTTVHLSVAQTDSAASVRFAFFFMQSVCMLLMAASVAVTAIGATESEARALGSVCSQGL